MTTRYVGAGGNDANSGLTWALRKLTLNGVEDTPVQAGDTVYVGPGAYRELLTVDVSGTAGNTISYIGDYTGANTDGTGGVARITGSDNDQTATRANCIAASSKNYRTFTGFQMDGTTQHAVSLTSCTNITIQQCYITALANTYNCITSTGAGQSAITVQNAYLWGGAGSAGVYFGHTATINDTGDVVSNCIISTAQGIHIYRIGGATVRNCAIFNCKNYGVWQQVAPATGQSNTVNNCIIFGCNVGIAATAVTDIIEDYNSLNNITNLSNVNAGTHSNAYLPVMDSRWFFEMLNGGRLVTPFDLSAWSQLINVAGTSPPATDMRGTTVQGAQREWGPLEYDTTLLVEGGGGAVSISPCRGNIG